MKESYKESKISMKILSSCYTIFTMLDIKFIRENKDIVAAGVKKSM